MIEAIIKELNYGKSVEIDQGRYYGLRLGMGIDVDSLPMNLDLMIYVSKKENKLFMEVKYYFPL